MRPRIRSLKPEMWADERVGDLTHGARLLFVGLITMADDEGRLRELPAAILGHIFPYDEVSAMKLSRWLSEVEKSGMVVRYSAGGKRYIAFRHWSRHQKVDRPNSSELPPPVFDESSSNHSTKDLRASSDPFDDDSRSLRAGADPIRSDPDPISSSKTTDARALFDYWQQACDHPAALFTDDRRRKVEARLKEGYTVGQIREAIDGAARAAFVNDAGQRFDDIELICRNGSKLESFIRRATAHLADRPVTEKEARSARRLAALHRVAGTEPREEAA